MTSGNQEPTALATEGASLLRRQITLPARLTQLAKRKPLGAVSTVVILVVIFAALFADIIAPYGFYEQNADARLQPSSSKYLMGTDNLGRDILSRVIFGARVSLFVGITAVGFGVAHGAFWGILSGYVGGKFDLFVQRIMDTVMSIPFLVMALVIVSTLGTSLLNVVVALAIVITPRANRLVRGSVLSIKENQYIEAARAIGVQTWRMLLLHILPNVMAPIIVLASLDLGSVIITEATLSFLGMGVPPPTPTWGGMLAGEGRFYMIRAPWIAVWPGAAISLTVLAFNLLGDALRDILDPRLRS